LARALAAAAAVLVSVTAAAAVKPGLEGAQDLFRQNRWEDARAHLRTQWGTLLEKDRPAASFLIGRSLVREAEFHRALRRFGADVGVAYLDELTQGKTKSAWIPLFRGLYGVDAEKDAEAERALLAVGTGTLPAEWKTSARLRRALALARLGRPATPAAAKDASPEARLCALLAGGSAEAPVVPKDDRRGRVLAAAVLFRLGRAAEAEAALSPLNLDLPDVEDTTDPKKLLRFHDPLLAHAWERIAWERAVVALQPLATTGAGTEKSLAAHYLGVSLFFLGATRDAGPFLTESVRAAPAPELQAVARLLAAASSWKVRVPAAAELRTLWDGTQTHAEAVLAWDEVRRRDLATLEPFATQLDGRLRALLPPATDRPAGALVGRWGLAQSRRGGDSAALVTTLSEYRDKSNKNKLEWNDPLLLLALAAANYRNQEYAQALETLFELSKTIPGLRSVQWNMQGVYAARQKSGGEARISQ
jgi:hypothetical protein